MLGRLISPCYDYNNMEATNFMYNTICDCRMAKRKQWSEESMKAALSGVKDNDLSLREASRLYNVPFETLRRRVTGAVEPGCRPGPSTVLTEEEEEELAKY